MSDTRERLLLVRAYFLENTNERHPVSLSALAAHLQREGVAADRRTLEGDVRLLQESGFAIQRRSRRGGYYLARRAFDPAEVRLLADMVRANRVLTSAQTEELLQKLRAQLSRHEAAELSAGAAVAYRRAAESEDALDAIRAAAQALSTGRKLSFLYCQIDPERTLRPRHGGRVYAVNPCLLVYACERYYLIADHPLHEGLAHYRLDRMTQARVLDEPSAPPDPAFDPAGYARALFSMYPGEPRWVRLAFDSALFGAMLDRFGADAPVAELDERTLAVSALVCVSAPFFGWVFQFGGRVRILAPDDVRERMALMLEAARGRI